MLVGYLGAHHHRFQRELGRLVGWPRRVPRQPHELAAELVSECSEVLEAPSVLIVWEEPEDGSIKLAWGAGADVTAATEPEATYGSFVVSGLERRTFSGDTRGRRERRTSCTGRRDPSVSVSDGRFIRHCRPDSTWSGSSPGASTAS